MTPTAQRSAVRWLTAQAVAFGVVAALLGIVANSMFLDEYGSSWLPVTYLFIAAAGIVVSGLVARAARSGELVRIAGTVLGSGVVLLVAAWIVAVGAEGAWVSAPLLVLFPVLIQLGFVFIGAQAGRMLDIAGIKAKFPRIVAGFPVGAVVGGVVAGPLLTLFGRTEHLLAATALAQAAFLALLLGTGRGKRAVASPAAPAATDAPTAPPPRVPMRTLLSSRFVLLIIGYQVLSAVGSQLADFLVYDRAAARYADQAELTRFVARYTAVMNVTSILFLALLAGVLLRRFGLRLGIAANPAVLAVLAAAMIVTTAMSGTGSLALLLVVSSARIADIALTDGTTRTSINATYQVVPEDERLAVQANVEGVGVPLAIGLTGVAILVLDALPATVTTLLVLTAVVCTVWTWNGVLLYREYSTALVEALDRRPSLDLTLGDADLSGGSALLASSDEREVLLGIELLGAAAPALAAELERLADDPRPEVRSSALIRLAAGGDPAAAERLWLDVAVDRVSPDPIARRRAARALAGLAVGDRLVAVDLLDDADPDVRCAALESIREGDVHAVNAVVAALADQRTCAAAASAIDRLGDAAAPAILAELARAGKPAPPHATRVALAARALSPDVARDVLAPHVGHPDRELGLAVLRGLAVTGPPPAALADALVRILHDELRHAAWIARATTDCSAVAPPGSTLARALVDELDLVRDRVAALLVALHGPERLSPAMLALAGDERHRAIAVEVFEVTVAHAECPAVIALLRNDLTATELVSALPAPAGATPSEIRHWLSELVADPHERWRSEWLCACALAAAVTFDRAGASAMVSAVTADLPLIDELLADLHR